MKKLLFLFAITGLIFTGCNDDEDDNNDTNNDQNPAVVDGSITATMNGSAFNTDSVRARELSGGGLFIEAVDQNGRRLRFDFDNFIGNGTYVVGPQLTGEARYTDVVNGNSIFFINGTGTLVVSDYQESSRSFNAEFVLAFSSAIDPGIVIDATGNFLNVQLISIPEPQEGGVVVFNNEREYYTEYTPTAWTTHTQLLWINLEGEGSLPERVIAVDMDEVLNPSGVEYNDDNEFGQLRWYIASGSRIISWEYDEANQTISGHIKSIGRGDYEVKFNKVPVDVIQPISTVAGDIFYYSGNDTIRFDQAELIEQFDEGVTTRNFEATNSDGQKLSYMTVFDGTFEAMTPSDGPLIRLSLFFSDDSGTYPSEGHSGRLKFATANDLPSDQRFLIFEATDRTALMYAHGVDYIFVE
ncbi:MAG: hypothetical protein AAGC47_01545 [Bacteroidota bacterium]